MVSCNIVINEVRDSVNPVPRKFSFCVNQHGGLPIILRKNLEPSKSNFYGENIFAVFLYLSPYTPAQLTSLYSTAVSLSIGKNSMFLGKL